MGMTSVDYVCTHMFALEAWLGTEIEEVEFGRVGKLLLLYLPLGICVLSAQTLKDVMNCKMVYKIVWFVNKHRGQQRVLRLKFELVWYAMQ